MLYKRQMKSARFFTKIIRKVMQLSFWAMLFCLGPYFQARAQVSDTTSVDTTGVNSLQSDTTMVKTNTKGRKITLQEAINIALKRNYQLKQADNNLSLAQKQILGAKANFLPSVSANAGGRRTTGQQFNNTTLKLENHTRNSLNGSISANLTIFQGFSNIINLRQSEINKRYEKASRQRTRETVIFNAASGFLQVVLNQQLLKIARQNLAAAKQQLKQVRGQVQVGSSPSVDLYNQQATVASDQVNVTQQQNALAYSKTQLIGTLQLDPQKSYHFVAPKLSNFNPAPRSLSLSKLINSALNNRPDLKAQKLQIELNRKSLALQRANYYPSVSASAGLSSGYYDTYRIPNGKGGASTVSFGRQFLHQQVNRYFGISVNIPIFNHLNTRLAVQQAKINYHNSQLNYQNIRYTVLQEVRQAYNDYQSYAAQLSSTKAALKAARKTFQQQRQRYKVGAGTLIEVSNATAQYVQARSNRAEALLRFVFQKKLLNYYLGTIGSQVSVTNQGYSLNK